MARVSLVHIFLTVVLACSCTQANPPDDQAFIDWVVAHAVTVDDPDYGLSDADRETFEAAIGSARLVGLGESRHDTREQLLFKSRLIRHLIQNQGFRAIILEESSPHAELIDRYVTTGQGDPELIMNGLAGWYLWDTEEMLALVDWLRRYNSDLQADRKIRVFGVDVTAPAVGVESVLDALRAAGVETVLDAQVLGLDLQQGDFWPASWERYSALTEQQREELAAAYEELTRLVKAERAGIIAHTSEHAYRRLLLMSEIGSSGNALFSTADRAEGGAIRERGMAQTTFWYLDHEIPGEKAILWAHNLHVAKSTFRMPGLAEGELKPMGVLLSEKLGSDYIAVGASFGSGAYPPNLPPGEREFELLSEQVMDGALASAGLAAFLLDLREVESGSEAAAWLGLEREWRAQDAQTQIVPSEAFDLVYFVERITRSQPTPLALRRFQAHAENN